MEVGRMLRAHELSSEHLDTACDDCAASVSELTHVNFCRRAEFNRRDRGPPLTKARVGDSQGAYARCSIRARDG
jgi:hypothetical protein